MKASFLPDTKINHQFFKRAHAGRDEVLTLGLGWWSRFIEISFKK
jgi:hypothetical protein